MHDVFNRKQDGTPEISSGAYNLIIGLVLLWGFGLNLLMVKYVPVTILGNMNPLLFLLAYFGLCFFGIYLFKKSNDPFVSFIGYNFVVLPFGFIINIIVHQYNPVIVFAAIRMTGLVTVGMMMLGSMLPDFFKKIIGTLTIALILVIIVEMVEIFIFKIHHGFLDWIVVLIFCGYIGYDWGRANSIPKTADNAVDSAASLYMDIINLFLRILRIMGRRS